MDIPAQVIGTGPTVRCSAMPEMFESLIYSARDELVITTPYYVPDEAMQAALCAAARRGTNTSIIFPARNDSWIVAAASRSYYSDLLTAGVHIFEYLGGLLHTKSLTLDGAITLIGSANMDRRSFELNYEKQHPVLRPSPHCRHAPAPAALHRLLRRGQTATGRGLELAAQAVEQQRGDVRASAVKASFRFDTPAGKAGSSSE